MTVESLKLVYSIQNGQFKGQSKTADIQISGPNGEAWRAALDGVIVGVNAIASFISLGLYAKSANTAAIAFRAVGQQLVARELPNVAQDLGVAEIEPAIMAEYALEEAVAAAATRAAQAIVGEGLMNAGEAAVMTQVGAWVAAGTLAATGAIVGAGLIIYDIVNSGETPLASVVFVNCVPNSTLKFTAADWSDGMSLVGGDTKESMLNDSAPSTMDSAGALAYTWQTEGKTPNGTASVALKFDSGTTVTASLVWSLNPDTDDVPTCVLTGNEGSNLVTACCYKQPVVTSSGKKHFAMIYLLLPSEDGCVQVSPTRTPDQPLVFDSLWAADTGGPPFGLLEGKDHGSYAADFTVDGRNYLLRELVLPISGTKGAVVEVCNDDQGSCGAPVETFSIPLLPSEYSSPLVLQSVGRPRLLSGKRYWVKVGPSDPQSNGVWSASNYAPGHGAWFNRFTVGGDPIV